MREKMATGALLGVAIGDALGKPVEFVFSYGDIIRRHLGIYLPNPAPVTDDTEMTLAVARAVRYANGDGSGTPDRDRLERELRGEYVLWEYNNVVGRAAGHTCRRAAVKLRNESAIWQDCTDHLGKGCGANMRVTAVGLVPHWIAEDVANVAQLSAALSHGHPTALAAAELTALAVHLLRTGTCTLADLLPHLINRCREQRGIYRAEWLGHLADGWRLRKLHRPANSATARRAMTAGWMQVEDALTRVRASLKRPDLGGDVSRRTGAGWVAEQALATSLYAATRHRDEPLRAVRRAAQTAGDSDSLAAITGSFIGAAYGVGVWPRDWRDRVEYGDELRFLGSLWD